MKFLVFLTAMALAVVGKAQIVDTSEIQDEPLHRVYCELLGINKNVLGIGNKISVQVDFGEEANFWGNDGRDILIDDNGKEIKFNSMVDAMNFMGERGWRYQDSYVVTIGGSNVIHWLLYKEIADGESAKGDLKQRRDKKKDKKKKSEDTKYNDVYN